MKGAIFCLFLIVACCQAQNPTTTQAILNELLSNFRNLSNAALEQIRQFLLDLPLNNLATALGLMRQGLNISAGVTTVPNNGISSVADNIIKIGQTAVSNGLNAATCTATTLSMLTQMEEPFNDCYTLLGQIAKSANTMATNYGQLTDAVVKYGTAIINCKSGDCVIINAQQGASIIIPKITFLFVKSFAIASQIIVLPARAFVCGTSFIQESMELALRMQDNVVDCVDQLQ